MPHRDSYMTKILFIINPISGTSDKSHIIDLIPEYLDSSRFEGTIRKTEHKGHAAEFAAEAVRDDRLSRSGR